MNSMTKLLRLVRMSGLLGMLLSAHAALASIDPPVLVPSAPVENQLVSVSIAADFCDGFIEWEGYPQVIRTGNNVRLVVYAQHVGFIDFCVFPPHTITVPIGAFQSGVYSVQVDRFYIDDLKGPLTETLATIPFEVSGLVAAVALPSTSFFSLIFLGFGLLFAAVVTKMRRLSPGIFLVLFLVIPLNTYAGTAEGYVHIEVLIANDPLAPKPTDVVEWLRSSSRSKTPPLSSLAALSPESGYYLLFPRASGDFLSWIEANQNSARARLERYIVITFSPDTDLPSTLQSLRADDYVVSANESVELSPSSTQLINFGFEESGFAPTASVNQYGREQLNIETAWQISGGYSLIGAADTGLATAHAALRQFSASGQYLGGNFIPAASKDVAIPEGTALYTLDFDVDEAQPRQWPSTSNCYNGGVPIGPSNAGHGTHVSGLIAANGSAGNVKGTCKNCGLAMGKYAWDSCLSNGTVILTTYPGANVRAIEHLVSSGAQILNGSFGQFTSAYNVCAAPPLSLASLCDALEYAAASDVVIVASSGNARERIDFPASDSRSVAVGGINSSAQLWVKPGTNPPCSECGSNYSTLTDPNEKKQEVVASAEAVWSTTYPGYNWVTSLACGDAFPGPGWGNGEGLCTGTSMSAPQISGVLGILRSINSLVSVSAPVPTFPNPVGIRTVLANTTFEAQASQPWSATKGYGIPDAAAAAREMLGKVYNHDVVNRATPLFRLYSATNKDYAEVSSPQYALALLRGTFSDTTNPPSVSYSPSGPLVPGYSAFPQGAGEGPWGAPRSATYVLTTEHRTRPSFPPLIPLYLIDRTYSSGTNRDLTLITSQHIPQARTSGYNLRNIQGYIYQTCSPEPRCIPSGAQKFYRACKTSINDCATFLENERIAFEGQGYTTAWPTGSNKVLGYAYPADTNGDGLVDGDGDGLPDPFELVAGTNPALANSDGDSQSDGVEYPMRGVPVSDPCSGSGAKNCLADILFIDGFD